MKLKLVRKTRQVESVNGLCKGDSIIVGERRGKVAFHDYDTNQVVAKMEDGRRELMLLSMPVEVETVIKRKYCQVRPGEYFLLESYDVAERFLKIGHNILSVSVISDGYVGALCATDWVPHPEAGVSILQPDYEEELLDMEIPF